MPRLKTTIKPDMAVQMNLEAHERECAVRYQAVQDKLDSLDKRMWRLEGMQAVTTLSILGLVISIVLTQEYTMGMQLDTKKVITRPVPSKVKAFRAGKPIIRKSKKMGKRQGKQLTPKQKLQNLSKLLESNSWKLIVEIMEEEIVTSAMSIAESPKMDLEEINFRRGAIWAGKQLLEMPNRLKIRYENEIALEKVDENKKKSNIDITET